MKTGRLEAFSDGVLAIIITIMVLEMKAPKETTFEALLGLGPIFISYLLSFIYLGIYWNNHHHLFQVTEKVNGKILWANLHLLFWLSLIPFATSWVGEHHASAIPVAFYGFVLLMSSIAYRVLEKYLIKHQDKENPIHLIAKNSTKETVSIFVYILSIPLAFLSIWISIACFIIIAILWVIPSKTLESSITQ